TQSYLPPKQHFAFALIRTLLRHLHDGNHAPIQLSHYRLGTDLGRRHLYRTQLCPMDQTLTAHASHRYFQSVMFMHRLRGLGKTFFGAKINHRSLHSTRIASRLNSSSNTEWTQYLAPPTQPPLYFLHVDPSQRGQPRHEFFFPFLEA